MSKKRIRVGSVLIVKNNKILLVKSRFGGAKGLWNNPGGWAEKDESYEDCAVREAREETGFKVKLLNRISVFYFKYKERNVVKNVYLAKIISGKLVPQEREIEEARWFRFDEIIDNGMFTAGVIISVQDYASGKFNKVHNIKRIARL